VKASGNKLELPLDIHATAFQRRVWADVAQNSSGTTVTYSEKAPASAGALHFLRQQSRPSLSSSSNTPAP
jgi:O6-methylguanine-DNA--protein-cysteine methyltransferase